MIRSEKKRYTFSIIDRINRQCATMSRMLPERSDALVYMNYFICPHNNEAGLRVDIYEEDNGKVEFFYTNY